MLQSSAPRATVANELSRAFPAPSRNRVAALRSRGRPYVELGFKITCLDKQIDSVSQIRHEELSAVGLGMYIVGPSCQINEGRLMN